MNIRYRVSLTPCERDELRALLGGGRQGARKLKRAQILLAADAGVGDEEIAASVGVGGSTVYRTKRRFVDGNLERALSVTRSSHTPNSSSTSTASRYPSSVESNGSHNPSGSSEPIAIAMPPTRGIGWLCTFRLAGSSRTCRRAAARASGGISAIVTTIAITRVSRRSMRESQFGT